MTHLPLRWRVYLLIDHTVVICHISTEQQQVYSSLTLLQMNLKCIFAAEARSVMIKNALVWMLFSLELWNSFTLIFRLAQLVMYCRLLSFIYHTTFLKQSTTNICHHRTVKTVQYGNSIAAYMNKGTRNLSAHDRKHAAAKRLANAYRAVQVANGLAAWSPWQQGYTHRS